MNASNSSMLSSIVPRRRKFLNSGGLPGSFFLTMASVPATPGVNVTLMSVKSVIFEKYQPGA